MKNYGFTVGIKIYGFHLENLKKNSLMEDLYGGLLTGNLGILMNILMS
ncbi:MAG: hypothetical protein K9L62_02090 [Vallitaleaceae bacterium]|nr:hypothetical protein [Vallitaleaceae bacterium]